MKTYKGQELIKAAKYLQKMGSVRSKIEQDFTLDSIDVEDREATVHYLGKVEGEDAKLNVTVFKAKTYGNVYAAYLAGQRFEEKEYDKVYIWLHTITKLDTEEAKTGKLQLLPEQWNKVHKDFMKKFFKDFNIDKHDQQWPECFVEFRYLGHGSFKEVDDEFGLILLSYDPALKDFKKSSDDYQFDIDIGISNDTTKLALGYYIHDYAKELNAAFKAVLPMAENGISKIIEYSGCSGYYYVEGTYDEILEICKGMKERLFAYYDEIIKARGGNPNWRSAIRWEESGPIYPADSEESAKAKELLDAKENALKAASIERVVKVAKAFYNVNIVGLFKDSTIECNGYRFADSVTIKVPYKFPKVKGSKVVMQDKVLEIDFYRDDYPRSYGEGRYDELTVTYSIPAIYGTMSGEYVTFEEALKHDSEKLMTLKATRKKGRAFSSEKWGACKKPVFTYIQNLIDDLEKYLKYKGFAPKA